MNHLAESAVRVHQSYQPLGTNRPPPFSRGQTREGEAVRHRRRSSCAPGFLPARARTTWMSSRAQGNFVHRSRRTVRGLQSLLIRARELTHGRLNSFRQTYNTQLRALNVNQEICVRPGRSAAAAAPLL